MGGCLICNMTERLERIVSHVAGSYQCDGLVCTKHKNGCVTMELNRPSAMNSLSLQNIIFMYECLLEWKNDPAITHVVIYPHHIKSPEEQPKRKAFCAGGDLKEFISCDRVQFTHREYRLDCLIQKYPKPIISLLDGVVMGGGAGIGCLPAFRIVTPNTLFSMPEAAIGWNTDCGATYYLSAPRVNEQNGFSRTKNPINNVGEYLVMTGTRLHARDLFVVNVATHFLSDSQKCCELLDILQSEKISPSNSFENIQHILNQQSESYLPELEKIDSILIPHKEEIEKVFGMDNVEDILDYLNNNTESPWNRRTLGILKKQCPCVLKVVFQEIRRAKGLSVEDCLKIEFRVGLRLKDREDLQEGVASVLIRKDFKPSWYPSSLNKVSDAWVNACFNPSTVGFELNDPPLPGIME